MHPTHPTHCTGAFESHLTVALPPDPASLDRLRAFAAPRGLKVTHIVLAEGRSPSQPMLTCHARGTLEGELAACRALAEDLAAAGFPVTRTKVEVDTGNPTVPAAAHAPPAPPFAGYFEHHLKLVLHPGWDEAGLTALARAHGAHLSRNALRTRADGSQERFITQRVSGVSRATAAGHLASLCAALAAAGHVAVETEEEFVVYDDHLALDAGWAEADSTPIPAPEVTP